MSTSIKPPMDTQALLMQARRALMEGDQAESAYADTARDAAHEKAMAKKLEAADLRYDSAQADFRIKGTEAWTTLIPGVGGLIGLGLTSGDRQTKMDADKAAAQVDVAASEYEKEASDAKTQQDEAKDRMRTTSSDARSIEAELREAMRAANQV